ncbi:cold-responsive protein kinase 1-like isoform X1 [Silene latifolia]|uniref:cold-responsive protein kinase 1-like isoform X1 n=1 Tax=Silene latifolia TaxID=37657 RepID=UPI003D77AA0C
MTCFPCFSGRRANSAFEPTSDFDGGKDAEVGPSDWLSYAENVQFYTYKELQSATDNFNKQNKIGQGGFGSVYKGKLRDGTLVAIKVLSPESRQGLREFLTELTVLADIKHENLVEMLGCCVEGDNRILLSRYLENNSLAKTLLGLSRNTINFSWIIRRDICIGIAKGLAFLHEEVQPHIIHRDIKASNILLDKDLTAKLSDFGLAKLIPANMTHVSTKVAGTLGYLAPEYALRGQLTRKADIYSFGVLLLEVVCGRCNKNRQLPAGEEYLLQRAWAMLKQGALVELVDEAFRGDIDVEEANRFLKIALLCTQQSPNRRPVMSSVVGMLQGEEDVSDMNITQPGILSDLKDVKIKENQQNKNIKNSSQQLQQSDLTRPTFTFTSIGAGRD